MNSPLVSCIMPTANRPHFVKYAIDYFLHQDYRNLELVIVDDGEIGIEKDLLNRNSLRYFKVAPLHTIGLLRNLACQHAKGEIIVHWDDDDWYAEDWVTKQVAALQSSGADICGLNQVNFYAPALRKRETFIDDKNAAPWVYGATMAYNKSFWLQHPFGSFQTGEDNDFVLNSGAKVFAHDYTEGYLGILHAQNLVMMPFENPREKLKLEKWIKVIDQPAQPIKNRDKIEDGEKAFVDHEYPEFLDLPLVSCIMPTANRRNFVAAAICYFQMQDYPNKELIILDNGIDPIKDLVPDQPEIKYFYVGHIAMATLGMKRNMAISKAEGSLIMHWDDDDWYATDWMSRQVEALLSSEADLCGINQVQFFSPSKGQYWMSKNFNSKRPWLTGASLIYRKSFWKAHPFKDLQIGEDDDFIRNTEAKVYAHDYYQGFMATLHANNTSIKFFENQEEKLAGSQE